MSTTSSWQPCARTFAGGWSSFSSPYSNCSSPAVTAQFKARSDLVRAVAGRFRQVGDVGGIPTRDSVGGHNSKRTSGQWKPRSGMRPGILLADGVKGSDQGNAEMLKAEMCEDVCLKPGWKVVRREVAA